MTSLYLLDISSNHLEGEIPASISRLTFLTYLILYGNKFTGDISNSNGMELPTLCQLNGLLILDLSHNQFFGELPRCIWDLQYLAFMDLSSNALVGELPTMNSSHSSLISLYLGNNNVTGYFPALLKNFGKLSILDLGNNKISGTIPPWIHKSNPMLRSPTTIKYVIWKYSLAAFTPVSSPCA